MTMTISMDTQDTQLRFSPKKIALTPLLVFQNSGAIHFVLHATFLHLNSCNPITSYPPHVHSIRSTKEWRGVFVPTPRIPVCRTAHPTAFSTSLFCTTKGSRRCADPLFHSEPRFLFPTPVSPPLTFPTILLSRDVSKVRVCSRGSVSCPSPPGCCLFCHTILKRKSIKIRSRVLNPKLINDHFQFRFFPVPPIIGT